MATEILGLISRWAHVIAAITAVGGSIFMRFALLPAVQQLSDDQRKALHEAVRSRWSKLVAASVLFLLASGLYNLISTLSGFRAAEVETPSLYNMLFGVKFLLALGVFYIASSLSGKSEKTASFRQNAKFWMNVNLSLALTIVLISGVLRSTHTAPSALVNPPADNAPLAD